MARVRNVGETYEVMKAFVDGRAYPHQTRLSRIGIDGYSYEKGRRVFHKGNVIYSYGMHFALAWKLGNGIFLLNGDEYSVTTRKHQSDLRSALGGEEKYTISQSAFENAGINPFEIDIIDSVGDATGNTYEGKNWLEKMPMGATLFYRKGVPYRWHRAATLAFKDEQNRYWLCGFDEGSYFLSRLPRRVISLVDAYESLKPDMVIKAEAKNIEVLRQGEWFFIPKANGAFSKRFYKKCLPAKPFTLPRDDRRSNPHTATRGGMFNGVLIVSGAINHPEHRSLRLSKATNPALYFAYKNTATDNFSADGGVD